MAESGRSREAVLAEIRTRFIAQTSARFWVALLVGLSGLAAFLFSAGTLALGLHQMGVRYLGATVVGYGAFLLLLRVWIAYKERERPFDLDVPDPLPDLLPELTTRSTGGNSSLFGGGRSGGAGASGHWSATSGDQAVVQDSPDVAPVEHAAGLDVDFDEFWPVVIAFVCAIGGVLAILYVVYAAPALLAEVALDAALVTGLYRKLRREDARYWLESALRRTWLPALLVGVFLMLAGFAIQWAVPSADSIGDLWRAVGE